MALQGIAGLFGGVCDATMGSDRWVFARELPEDAALWSHVGMRSKGAAGGRRTGLSNLAKSRMKAKLRGRMRYRLLLFLKSLLVATASMWHLWCFAPVEPSGAGRAQPALPLECAGGTEESQMGLVQRP